MAELVFEILAGVFEHVLGGLFYHTGQVILYVLTFGKRRMRWRVPREPKSSRKMLARSAPEFTGFVFWLAVGIAVCWILF